MISEAYVSGGSIPSTATKMFFESLSAEGNSKFPVITLRSVHKSLVYEKGWFTYMLLLPRGGVVDVGNVKILNRGFTAIELVICVRIRYSNLEMERKEVLKYIV